MSSFDSLLKSELFLLLNLLSLGAYSGFNVRFESGWGWRLIFENFFISSEGFWWKYFNSFPSKSVFIVFGLWNSNCLSEDGIVYTIVRW